MKMPSRADFADPTDFLTAIAHWNSSSAAAYEKLHGMFWTTPEVTEKPEWVDQANQVKNVSLERRPDTDVVDVAIRTLSGSILHSGMFPVQLCHGAFEDEDGNSRWAIFVEVSK